LKKFLLLLLSSFVLFTHKCQGEKKVPTKKVFSSRWSSVSKTKMDENIERKEKGRQLGRKRKG